MKKFSLKLLLSFGLLGAATVASAFGPISIVPVDAGQVAYVYHRPGITAPIMSGGFLGVIKGPGSDIFYLRDVDVVYIDYRPRNYSEHFKILARDDLNIKFSAHAIIYPRHDQNSVRDIVETFGGEQWYNKIVQKPFRTFVREAVQGFASRDVKTNRKTISDNVLKELRAYFKDKPFEVDSVSIGNVDYPDVVEKAVEEKLATQQLLEKKDTEKKIAEREAEIRVIEANGIAEAQEIIKKSLSDLYIQREAIEALKKLADSPNKVVVYIPSGSNGVPLVKNLEDGNGK